MSVVIPFYSGKTWLISAIESVLTQTYNNVEILVINDGSKEDISNLISKYRRKVHFINQNNGGPSKARNTGIQKSKGKYIAFLDSDDIWYPEKLKKQISYMEANKSAWSQHSYLMFWDNSRNEKIVETVQYQGNVLRDCYISLKIQTSTVVVRKDILEEYEIKFPEGKRYGQDMVFFRQLAEYSSLGYVEGVLSKFRIRGNNAGFRSEVQLANRAEVWRDIRNNKKLVENLPWNVIMAYKLSEYNNQIVYKIIKKLSRVDRNNEGLYKLFYVLPYCLFKFSSK